MNILKTSILVFLLAFPHSALAQEAKRPYVEIGIADLSQTPNRIIMGGETATRPGVSVHLIFVDPTASSILLTGQKLGWTIKGAQDASTYIISGSEKISGLVGFALYGPILDFAVVDGVPEIDVTGDGVDETLTTCLTSEGIRLTVQSFEGETVTTVWEKYVALPFDVKANCK